MGPPGGGGEEGRRVVLPGKENRSLFVNVTGFFSGFPQPKVSGSKIWQTERSCMCCQESGEREASVALFCPKAGYDEPKVRKVKYGRFRGARTQK